MNIDKILVATTNKGKLKEFSRMLGEFNIKVLSLDDMKEKISIEESGKTFLENAIKKAEGYAKFYKMPVIAEDAGLEIDALDKYPGVYSSRFYALEYGGKLENVEDKDKANIEKVLRLMKGKTNRTARFKSVIAFYYPDDFGIWSEGICEGKIAENPIGSEGFGYDPIFIPKGYDKTMAQLSPDEKNRISHRGKAVRKLITLLKKLT